MTKTLLDDEEFVSIDFTNEQTKAEEYESCNFRNCNFLNSNLSEIKFTDCVFESCDLSMSNISNTAFRSICFNNCKLMGLHFEDCNKFLLEMKFKNCLLNMSCFYKIIQKATKFVDCNLHEVDFTESELSNSTFHNCDLQGAIFLNTILEKVDFRNSFDYSINPETNRINKAKFSYSGITGLLNSHNIFIE